VIVAAEHAHAVIHVDRVSRVVEVAGDRDPAAARDTNRRPDLTRQIDPPVPALKLAVENTLLTEGTRDTGVPWPNEVAVYQPLGC
jgi:hypothetical protein